MNKNGRRLILALMLAVASVPSLTVGIQIALEDPELGRKILDSVEEDAGEKYPDASEAIEALRHFAGMEART